MALIVDVDGVLLNWEKGFREYAESYGYHIAIPEEACGDSHATAWYAPRHGARITSLLISFQTSEEFGELEEVEGARAAIEKWRSENPGDKIIAVSSCGTEAYTQAVRRANLQEFGLDEIHCLDLGAAKYATFEVLKEKYGPSFVVDDRIFHVSEAQKAGHTAIFFRSHGRVESDQEIVFGWDEFCKNISKSQEIEKNDLHPVYKSL